jgi:glyoxylase-like metal-dependent hydrolase (beta-lactamase superfamily II)
MDRKGEKMIRHAIAVFAVAAGLPAGAQDFSKVEITSTKLSETTYMMEGSGGNLGLSVGEDAVVLIDDQFAPLSERITAAIARLTPKPVRFVLNTHWHYDHTGGNENFGKAGAIIVAHENVRNRMSSDQFIEFFKQKIPASPRGALPVVTFAGSVSLHLNGEEMRVVHVPRAHTDGDAMVHFVQSDVIHMGDVYFNGMYPFIDTSSGGTIQGMIAGCDRALAIAKDSTRIIPGHGPLSNKAELKAYRDMLAAVADRIGKLVGEGKTPEQIAAAKPTADFDEKWGKGFIKPDTFTPMVANNMVKNR